jgi:plastocyanin
MLALQSLVTPRLDSGHSRARDFARRLLLRASVAAGLGLAASAAPYLGSACYAADAAAPATIVKIDNFTFAPATLSVPVGTTVTWVNEDDIPHVVAEQNRAFKSKALDTDDSFTHTFSTPGTFAYFCALHPHMVGSIIVLPEKPAS